MSQVGHDTEGYIHGSKTSLIQGMGKPWMSREWECAAWLRVVLAGTNDWKASAPETAPRGPRRPSLSNSWNSLSTPSLSIELRGDSRDYKCAGDLFIQGPRNNGWNEMSEVPRFWAAVHWSSSGKGRMLVLSWLRLTTRGEKTATAGTGMRLHLLQAPPAGIPLSTFG